LINNQVGDAIDRLSSKLIKLNLDTLQITEYNRKYLKKYIDNYSFYMSLYSQLLFKAINKLKKPISESTFVDYGGGCGMLSYLAREIGFRYVVYNDIYKKSVDDAIHISNELNINIDLTIHGDIDVFVNQFNTNDIKPDIICSFDVLEHIYNLENWFRTIAKINSNFSLFFMTSANPKNPFISNRLKKLQIKAEYQGFIETEVWKETDLKTSFLESRKTIIKDISPKLNNSEIELLSKNTRGLRKDDIENVVVDFIKTGKINYQIDHPTNTCDPYTGNWTEHLIDLTPLKNLINDCNLSVEITNSFYAYSNNQIFNVPKFVLNILIKILGKKNLIFSPTYTLEVMKE